MSDKKFKCVIPARYQSTRFPGKALAKLNGQAMIDYVYQNARAARLVAEPVVATDDERILKHCEEKGFKVEMTDDHRNGSERVGEIASHLDDEYVFEMQGDQPLLLPEQIDDFLSRAATLVAENPAIDVVHPYATATEEQVKSPNVVKAFKTNSGRLLFQLSLIHISEPTRPY